MRHSARPFIRTAAGSAIGGGGDAGELHSVIDEAEAEPFGDALLQRLELVVDELDDVAALNVDQMVMVRFRRLVVARAAVAELVPLGDSGFLEQANGAVASSNRDVGVTR